MNAVNFIEITPNYSLNAVKMKQSDVKTLILDAKIVIMIINILNANVHGAL